MAQGLNVRALGNAKSPTMETKRSGDSMRRPRGMGSRRIFSPQFKIQVLDSYRKDADCRGNQRATARKYNIHRRQIQKWLQCEQNLRTTVEESGKCEAAADLTNAKLRKKADSENKTDLTLNQSATAMATARLVDAGESDEETTVRQEVRTSRTEAQKLKRVAQRLYPSLQNISCSIEKNSSESKESVEEQKYFGSDVASSFGLAPGSGKTRDDNYNNVCDPTNEEEPLDLKSKAWSETLPEKFIGLNVEKTSSEDDPDKLKIRDWDNCPFGLASSVENAGGPKSSASNPAHQCLVQKYNMSDIEQRSQDFQRNEVFCSQSISSESSCLPNVPLPKSSNSSASSASPKPANDLIMSVERKLSADDDNVRTSSVVLSPGKCSKKFKTDDSNQSVTTNQVDFAKSFNPKRKWIEESMQEMMGEVEETAESLQEPSSFPIKQRVKMNLKSFPDLKESKKEDVTRNNGVSSNFTIEKLCSPDPSRECATSQSYGAPESYSNINSSNTLSFPPSSMILPSRYASDAGSFHLKPFVYNHESHPSLDGSLYSPCDYSLNLPLKEEKVSDGEDADVDVLSTTPVEKKSFDFSSYNFGKRRSFSVQFKLTVLDAFYNDKDCNKNQRATARKFNINRRQVQKWLSQENELRSESSLKNGKYLQRQRLAAESFRERIGCTGCPQHCLQKKENLYRLDEPIEVNVKPCSDKECLSSSAERRRDQFSPDHSKTGLTTGLDFYARTLFPGALKTENFYQGYLYPENNNVVYRDPILGWSQVFNSSALTVPNFQCLSPWHRGFDFCPDNPKIY